MASTPMSVTSNECKHCLTFRVLLQWSYRCESEFGSGGTWSLAISLKVSKITYRCVGNHTAGFYFLIYDITSEEYKENNWFKLCPSKSIWKKSGLLGLVYGYNWTMSKTISFRLTSSFEVWKHLRCLSIFLTMWAVVVNFATRVPSSFLFPAPPYWALDATATRASTVTLPLKG